MPEGQERWNTWIDKDLMHAVRVATAVKGMSQRAFTEEAMRLYLRELGISVDEVAQILKGEQ